MRAVRAAVAGLAGVLLAVSLLAFLDRFTWFFELFDFFRLQYLFLAFALALAATLLRQPWVTGLALGTAVVNLVVLLLAWRGPYRPPLLPGPPLTVLLSNVEFGNSDFAAVIATIVRARPDVVGLTELSPAWSRALKATLRTYPYRRVAILPSAYGIGLFSRLPMRAHVVHLPTGGPASVIGRIRLGTRTVTFVLTHPHTPFGTHAGGLHRRQFEALAREVPRLGPRVAVCGDLNTVPWSWPFRQLESAAQLHDMHRGDPFEGSWPSWAWFLRVPIDNCLTGDGLAVVSHRTLAAVGSDHLPLLVQLASARAG